MVDGLSGHFFNTRAVSIPRESRFASRGDCDENTLEDEDGIPPTFHFNPNGTITFDYCYVVDIAYLNNPSITTTSYTFANDTLKFSVIESDQGDFHETKGVLLYNQTTNRFTGTYSWKSWYMGNLSNDCSNTISIYK